MHVYKYKSYVSTIGTEEDIRDLPHSVGPAHL